MNSRKAIIFTGETLMAHGLKNLLAELCGIEAHIARDPAAISAAAEPDFFFADAHVLVRHLSFFLPRKAKTIVLSPDGRDYEEFRSLNTCATLGEITNAITEICHSPQASDTTDGELPLSQREIDVLRLVTAGRINKEIAAELNISVNTVLTHRKNITAKLGIKSVSGLTFYAMMNGII